MQIGCTCEGRLCRRQSVLSARTGTFTSCGEIIVRLRTVVLTVATFVLATIVAVLAGPGEALAGYTWSN
ncbi:hypothetical protein GCM10010109_21620 [Actinoplanes campanulatus]|nr:hypothetical protein GCM10010109_21620 [Actinoplanes campanulatus]GID36678.1 hypothetical protein Aca09nite_31840 [Actinoplanes campanulatus]